MAIRPNKHPERERIQGPFPEAWRTRVVAGDLTDAETVRALRAAAPVPEVWEIVSPSVKSALLLPEVKIKALGGTLDDLFVMLLGCLEDLAHPKNRNFASTRTALEHVALSLDILLKQNLDADAKRGREVVAQRTRAARARATRARARSRANDWRTEVESRRDGVSKEAVYARIERRERLQPGSVKKAVLRLINRK